MKIVAINGSPRGKESNTSLMVSAFLTGAQKAGAETVNIFLAEKELKHCRGCFSCWLVRPGQCVIQDDMAEILSSGEDASILVLATPLRYGNISGMLKVFIERMLPFANPYLQKDQSGETRHPKKAQAEESSIYRSQLVMIANGGYPDRSYSQVVSHWIKRLAHNNITEVIGEIYAPQGMLLNTKVEALRPIINNYLQSLENAGKEIVINNGISEETQKLLEQDFLPHEIYIKEHNRFVDRMLNKLDPPCLKEEKSKD